MATNYSGSAVEAPTLQSAAPILTGVATQAPDSRIINDIFSSVAGVFEAKAEAKKKAVLADFLKQQGTIADALDQGAIRTSAEARTRSRKVLMDAIDAHPSLATDFLSAQATFMGLAGGGDIIKEGSDEEQLWKAKKASLVEAGMISPDATDTELHTAAAESERIAALKKQYDIRMQTLEMKSKELSLSAAERAEVDAEKQDTAYKFVTEVAPSEFKRVKTAFDQIVNGSGTQTEKQQAIEDFWGQFLSDATTLGMQLKSEDRTVFMKPFETMREDYIKRATGVYSDSELDASIKRSIAQQKVLALSDPDIARFAAGTELFGSNSFVEAMATASNPAINKAMKFMAFGTMKSSDGEQPSPFATSSTDRAGMKAYLDSLNQSWNTDNKTLNTETAERAGRVLSSVSDYQGLVSKDPKSAIELVNWLASTDFQKMVTANPSLLKDAEAAKEALRQNYSDEVMGMINREFTNNQVVVPSLFDSGSDFMPSAKSPSVPATSLVTTQTTALGMQFVPIDPKDQMAVDKALELNKTLKPIINTQVRAWAHLDGRSDYGKYWEELSPTFLDTNLGADTGDDIKVEDFRKLAFITSEFQPLQAIVDKTEGGGNYDTLLSHSQRKGGAFEDVQVSKMTIAEAVDFSNGDYAQFSKEQVGRKATPMGRYQIVGQTLASVAKEMGLPPDTVFDETTQDAMFAHLVQKALNSSGSLKGKRAALRGVWEGFKNASNSELDAAIEHFEE